MILEAAIKKSIDKCVLCWLATSSHDHVPNVSPKEIFSCFGAAEIIIANIASPQSVRNIRQNEKVCISFIDILIQKGYQLKGKAVILEKSDPGYDQREMVLTRMTKGKFPFASIISIEVNQVKPIIAPSYILYPETTEPEQIESARKTYGI